MGVPLRSNVNGFQEDFKQFVGEGTQKLAKEVVERSAGTPAVHIEPIACDILLWK